MSFSTSLTRALIFASAVLACSSSGGVPEADGGATDSAPSNSPEPEADAQPSTDAEPQVVDATAPRGDAGDAQAGLCPVCTNGQYTCQVNAATPGTISPKAVQNPDGSCSMGAMSLACGGKCVGANGTACTWKQTGTEIDILFASFSLWCKPA